MEESNELEITIKLDAFTLAYIAAEEHGILAPWEKSTQYEILNAVRKGINNTTPENKSAIAKELRNGVYLQSNIAKWMGENDTVVPLKDLDEA